MAAGHDGSPLFWGVTAVAVVVVSTVARTGFLVTVWICLGIAVAGVLGGVLLLWAGRARLFAPDLPRWHADTEPAWESPPVLARLRPWRASARGGGT